MEQQAEQQAALQSLGLGAHATQLDVAEGVAAACRLMYDASPLHLGPESAYFESDGDGSRWRVRIADGDAHSLLRPEYVESLHVLHSVTRKPHYRAWGWKHVQALQAHARVTTGGYAAVVDVREASAVHRDAMESFFLSETLKYLWLLFQPGDVVPLEQWVFNTQGHPVPLRQAHL